MTIRSSSSHRCKRAFKRRLILESLEARHLLAADFGDAPAPYPVTLEENGARHESVGPTLGLVRDSEVNGTHSANADSDGIDEDAVLSEFDLQATVGANPAVTMLVSNPTGSEATLAGWIDYDQDGSFEASERATAVISPGTGSERVTLLFPDIPEGAAGNTFARFRFSTDASFTSNPSPVGLATDGEVEDYAFTFVSQTAGTVRKSVKLASLLNGVPAISTGNFYHAPTTIGDFDGDGIDDLVVASRGLSGQNQPGSVYLHRMKEDGTVRETTSFSINSPNFGTDVTAAGDINGDGVTDLVVGSNVADGGNGAVFVTFLNSDGTLQSSTKIGTNLNGGPPLRDDDIFGNSVTAIGDLDGDGVSEIVVGANGDDLPADNNGVAYVLFLNRDGTVKRFVRLGEGLNGIPAGTLVRNDSFGYRVDAIGDLNQDGIPDLAVHAPGDDTGGPTRGAVYLLFLAADGTVQSHKKLASNLNGVPTLDDGDQLGRGLGVLSDLDGNGVRELAVGTIWNDTEGTDRGAIYILYMESDGTVSRHVRIADGVNGGPSLADGDKFGTHIASVGDLDGDGVHEIAVTALHDDSGNPNQGAVHVLFMNSAPTNPPSLDPIPDRSLDEDQKQIVLLVPAESPGRVDRIDAKTGTLLDSFGEGVLTSPTDVAIGPEGHYYVVDKTNRAVQKFDRATFEYLGRIVGSLGLRDEFPPSLLVRENGNVLVSTGSTVNEYLNDGSDAGDSRQNDVVDMELGRDASLLTLRGGGSAGRYPSTYPSETHSGNSRFSRAVGGGVAFDASGNIFIAETFSADSDNRLVIQKVGSIPSAEENRAASFGESEIFVNLPGLGGVTDIDFGPDHHLYLSDASLNQIIVVDGQTGEIRQRLQNIDQNGHIAVVTLPGLHPQDATIELTGIGDGDGRNQPLSVTAVSNNPSLIPNPTVDYMSNSDSGRLTITPTADQSGIANITVTVMDGGADDDLQTLQDNKSTLRTFQIQIDSSASIAHDDTTVMWRTDIESETIHVPIGELLQNDFLGKYESVDDVTVIVPSQSKYGGTVELNSGTLTYQRPATYFPGVDEIVYTLDDGGHVSTATLYVLGRGPGLTNWGIPLEPGRSHDVILMRNEIHLTLLDRPTGSVIFKIPLKSLLVSRNLFRQANLMLAPEHENRVELRHLSAPNPVFFPSSIDEIELQTGIWAGASGLDQLIVTGRGQEWGDSNSGEIHGFGFFRFSGIGASDRSSYQLYDENGNNLLAQDLTIQNFENISSGRDNEPASYVDYGDRSFRFDSVFPYKFGNYSHLEGGSISSTSIMTLDTGNVFEGFGVLDGRFAGAPGSMVLPKGDLGIGNDESPAGFDTHGDLQIADHTVTLHDLNWAALGGLTSLGTGSKPGKLDAPNGLVIDFTDNVVGYGSVLAGTSEDPAVVMNNGWIAGDSDDRHITLAGLVKGVGSLTNVTINGIYSPGFSPALVRNGHVTYADQSTVLVELGGTIAGDQHDRIEHETARLSGTLQVELIEGFSPALGDAFKILTSELPFVGDFLAEKLPELPASLTWIVDKSPTEVVLRIGFQSDGDVRIKRNKDDDLLLIDANGNELPTGDDRIRIVVDPADDFSDDRDWKLKDAELKNGLLIQTVTDGNHELEIQGADWTNFVMRADVSDDGEVTSRDALLIINELGRNSVTDLDTGFLRDPASFASWPGVYYDQTGEGWLTSLDALRVINQLGRLDNAETGEAEAIAAPGMIWLPADAWAVEASGGFIERADFAHAISVPVTQAAADKFAIPAQHASPGESVGAVTSGDRILGTNNDVVDAVDLLLGDESSWIKGEV